MTPKKCVGLLFLLSILAFTSCGLNSEPQEKEEKKEKDEGITIKSKDGTINIESKEELKNLIEEVMEEKTPDKEKKSKTVNYEELKAMMPEWVGWLKRTDISGQRVSAGFVKYAEAEATYGSEAKYVKIKIIDNAFAAKFGSLDVFNVEIDKSSNNGYERTTEIQGYKAFEEYDKDEQSGSKLINVGSRFLVSIEGEGIDAATLQAAVDKLNLKKLERLKE
jgi:hypothetical protein